MKDKKPPKQNSGWFILFAVFFTIATFLLILLQATPASSTPPTNKIETLTNSSMAFVGNKVLLHKKEKVEKTKLNTLTQDWLKRYFESVSGDIGNGLLLKEQKIKGVQVGKSFLVYDVKLISKNNGFLLHLTMEPPEIYLKWENEIYVSFYPFLNPYIHVMDLIYTWTWTDQPNFNLQLEQMDIQTVSWTSNRYHNNYRDLKSSPLYKMPVPEPADFSKEEILSFLKKLGLFQTLTVVQQDLEVSDINGSSV